MTYAIDDKARYIRLAMQWNDTPPGYMRDATRAELDAAAYRVPLKMRTTNFIRRCGRPGDAIATAPPCPY